jgi:Mg2+/Co2+ transporter CorB
MAGKQKGGRVMAALSKLDTLPRVIKDEFIKKCLMRENTQAITDWLNNHHGIKTSKTSVARVAKAWRDEFGILIDLGMPIDEIIKHRRQIEALGVDQVAQQILDKLAEKNGSILAYLDKTEVGQ